MAEIVAAIGCGHAPGVVMHPQPDEAGAKARWHAAMVEARQRLAAARPTALLVVSNEHIQNFFFNNWPTFCLAFPEEMDGPFERHMPMPRYHVAGYPEFGQFLLSEGLKAHFDFASSQEFEPDHGVFIPLQNLRPEMDLPLTVLLQNCVEPPLPTLRRCVEVGRFLRQAIAAWPRPDRFALIAVGGLSHWIGVKNMGTIAEDWDRWLLEQMRTGNTDAIAQLTQEEIERDGGNGGSEIRNWLTVMAAVDAIPADILAYEAVKDWVIGAAVTYWDPLRVGAAR